MQDGGTRVLLVAQHRERAVASLVHRGCAADVAIAVDGDVRIGAYDDSRLGCRLRQCDGLVVDGTDEPLAFASAGKRLYVDDVHLLRARLDGQLGGIVRTRITLVGADANDVCSGRLELNLRALDGERNLWPLDGG